ncbi:hypothetical protein [Desulfosarcina sp.]|uniref:hypothetical protein n=1 Tax=Desulfosarcina sp. TaxID=2027861 RepID=UPI0035690E40
MIWHPLVWAFWVAAATGGLLYATAVVQAVDVMLNWTPARADIDQLRRERLAETAVLLGRWALGCLTAAALLGLVGLAGVWHRMVPGAMCGTGVLQAMGTDGSRAMIFWGLALLILYGWRVLDGLDGHHPQGVLTQVGARLMISAAPFFGLAVLFSWQALMRVENVPPVSCCAAVYDQVLVGASKSTAFQSFVPVCLVFSLAGSAVLLALAVSAIRSPDRTPGASVTIIAILWCIASMVAVKQVWSAYYYQVLSHPCPWCLFLPDYHGAGFIIFGGMAIVLMEGIALWLATRVRCRYPVLADPAGIRIRQSARRIAISVMVFTILTAGPAVAWRLRTGTWLDGSL